MSAPAGAVVGIYFDSPDPVLTGDVVQTRSGRRYGVIVSRVQMRGKRAGRQHLRAIVLDPSTPIGASVVHQLHWYRRT